MHKLGFIGIRRGLRERGGRRPGDGLRNTGEEKKGERHSFDSEDLGQKGFKSITSIITKHFIPLPRPNPPALCGLKIDIERYGDGSKKSR